MFAIVECNDIKFYEDNYDHRTFSRENITELIEDYIEFKNIKQDDFIETLINIIGNHPNGLHTANINHDVNTLFQMCHIYKSDSDNNIMDNTTDIITDTTTNIANKQNNNKFNGIASILTDMAAFDVYGKAIIFKIDTTDDINKLDKITLDDIIDKIIQKYVHKGVVIDADNVDNSIMEYSYVLNPVDKIRTNDINNYKYKEVAFIDKILMFFINITKQNISSKKNEIVSKIYGEDVFGQVFVGAREQIVDSRETKRKYFSISKEDILNIYKIYEQNKQIIIDTNDMIVMSSSGKRLYTNFRKIINKMLNSNKINKKAIISNTII